NMCRLAYSFWSLRSYSWRSCGPLYSGQVENCLPVLSWEPSVSWLFGSFRGRVDYRLVRYQGGLSQRALPTSSQPFLRGSPSCFLRYGSKSAHAHNAEAADVC